ncbi:hypothetical protein AGMMS49921_07590 [Endomicrobiia bacterium]|nr:hypothetical protein AGMMS49921_07590 [Endomicrobiia bacterium]
MLKSTVLLLDVATSGDGVGVVTGVGGGVGELILVERIVIYDVVATVNGVGGVTDGVLVAFLRAAMA